MRRRRRHHHHDFWGGWHNERQRRGHTRRRQRAQHWREYFHEQMGSYPEEHWAFGGRRFNPWRQGMDDFNPLVASLLSKGGGLLPLYVLHLLADAPRYGNELMELLSERTNGQWVANPGAIYPLMGVLEEQGLVTSAWEDPHKRTIRRYQVTEKGLDEMERLHAIVKPKLKQAIEVLKNIADDLNGDADYI